MRFICTIFLAFVSTFTLASQINKNRRSGVEGRIIVEGHNSCYLVNGYFPRDKVQEFLPQGLSLPDVSALSRTFPDMTSRIGQVPFLLSFCHGSEIHDVYTKINVPEQEELMFIFPVLYTLQDGSQALCSYVPVLYLNSIPGVLGGLYFGLRKEFHRNLQAHEHSDGKNWSIAKIIEANFSGVAEEVGDLPGSFREFFALPFVTLSYPPFPKLMFYRAKLYGETASKVSQVFYKWSYRGHWIESSGDLQAVFTEYDFGMSEPMRATKFFNLQ